MMNKVLVSSAVALAVSAAMAAPAQADTSITGSIRIGLLSDDGSGDNDISINNFGSRFIMSTSEDIGKGLTGIGRIEVGINANTTSGSRDGGFDRTRQVWGGLEGGFGTIKIGAQYSAFYDTITSKGDIAWWGSCFVEFECSREPAVLKYSGSFGDLSYAASIEGNGGDQDNDFADELEFGVGYAIAGIDVGAGVTFSADGDDFEDGTANDGGVLFGLAASGSFADVGLSAVFQVADEDFADDTDTQTVLTLTGTYKGFYGLLTGRDTSDDTLTNTTLGYQWNIADSTLMYFEVQSLGGPGDNQNIFRATLKRDFTILGG